MLHIVTANNAHEYRDEMKAAHRLRHKVFVEEKGWSALAKPDGLEVDQFDDEHAVHMLYIENGAVEGYQRMLPTTRPYLLTEVLSELCDEEPPRSPHVWEWTRYCVPSSKRERGKMLSPIATELLFGLVDWGIKSAVKGIVIEMNPTWMLRLLQLHFRASPLGLVQSVQGEDTVAVLANFDNRTLQRLRLMRAFPGESQKAA